MSYSTAYLVRQLLSSLDVLLLFFAVIVALIVVAVSGREGPRRPTRWLLAVLVVVFALNLMQYFLQLLSWAIAQRLGWQAAQWLSLALLLVEALAMVGMGFVFLGFRPDRSTVAAEEDRG